MRRLRASAVRAEATAQALCDDIAQELRVTSPGVWRSPFLFSPCLDGLRRPAILLPDDVGENLRETFIHELAHLARRDGLWNLLRRWTTAGALAATVGVAAVAPARSRRRGGVRRLCGPPGRRANRLCRASPRARRANAAAGRARERGHGVAPFHAGAADRAHPRYVAGALDASRRAGRRRDGGRRTGGNGLCGPARHRRQAHGRGRRPERLLRQTRQSAARSSVPMESPSPEQR